MHIHVHVFFSDGTEFPPDFEVEFSKHERVVFDFKRETDQKKVEEAVSNIKTLLERRHMVTSRFYPHW